MYELLHGSTTSKTVFWICCVTFFAIFWRNVYSFRSLGRKDCSYISQEQKPIQWSFNRKNVAFGFGAYVNKINSQLTWYKWQLGTTHHCLVTLVGKVPVSCAGGLGSIPGLTNTQGPKIIEKKVLLFFLTFANG